MKILFLMILFLLSLSTSSNGSENDRLNCEFEYQESARIFESLQLSVDSGAMSEEEYNIEITRELLVLESIHLACMITLGKKMANSLLIENGIELNIVNGL